MQNYLDHHAVPDRLYHGTRATFSAFEDRYKGRGSHNLTAEFGFYVTESESEAELWAKRTRYARMDPWRVLHVRIQAKKLFAMEYDVFLYYLQVARGATIVKHRQQWLAEGWEGFTVVREGIRWYCLFHPEQLEILA